MDKSKIYIIGDCEHNQRIEAMIAKLSAEQNSNIELITQAQAHEIGIIAPPTRTMPLYPRPLLDFDMPFQPPLTRAERRKAEREKLKKQLTK